MYLHKLSQEGVGAVEVLVGLIFGEPLEDSVF
jgi:hypothetical protein